MFSLLYTYLNTACGKKNMCMEYEWVVFRLNMNIILSNQNLIKTTDEPVI